MGLDNEKNVSTTVKFKSSGKKTTKLLRKRHAVSSESSTSGDEKVKIILKINP